MKRIIGFAVGVYLCAPVLLLAQVDASNKYLETALIDLDKVLEHLPSYQDVQENLALQTDIWNREIDSLKTNLTDRQKKFDAEEFLLTPALRINNGKQMQEMKGKILELERTRFGPDGDLFKRKKIAMQSILMQLNEVLKTIIETYHIKIIINKNEGSNIIFATPEADITSKVIALLQKQE